MRVLFTKGERTSKTQRGLRFISKTAESCETMVCLMLHKLTAASCIYTFMLVRPALRPAGPWAGKQSATATKARVHAHARASVRTHSHSPPLKGLFVQLEAALLGPAMPTMTHSPVKMLSAHSSSSKPQTNPLLRGILIGRLEGGGG